MLFPGVQLDIVDISAHSTQSGSLGLYLVVKVRGGEEQSSTSRQSLSSACTRLE